MGAEVISVSAEVLRLVAAYEARAILGPRYRNDLALGRRALTIYSPREVTTYGRNETDPSS